MTNHKTTHNQNERYKIIDSLISSGKYPSFSTILGTLREKLSDKKLSESSIRRDLRYMKSVLEAPIEFSKEKGGYYYSVPFNLPTNKIPEDEIILLGFVKKVLQKYSDSNPIHKQAEAVISKLFPSINDIKFLDRVVVSKGPKPIFDWDTLLKLFDALAKNYVVDFVYTSRWEPTQNHRTVLPCQLVLDNGQVFLYAADKNNVSHIRLYDIHKIYELKILTNQTFQLPENYRFEETFEKGRFGAFQYDESYDFKIAFFGNVARKRVHKYIWADDQKLEDFPQEEKSILSFSSSQWIPIQQWLLSFGGDAIPLEPDWFVENWKSEIEKMTKNVNLLK